MSYHEITVIGRLGRDPELRHTSGGGAVTSFPLAAHHRNRNPQGELVKETLWFQVTAWERNAENAAQYLKKGSQVMVKGRLTPDPETGSPRLWERRDGSAGASYEITAREIIFLGGRETDDIQDVQADNTPAQGNHRDDSEIPF